MIQFDDAFEVPASADTVMKRFMDVERVAQCVPGVTLEGRDDDGQYRGAMTVAFGPKRLKFQGKLRCDFDAAARTGTLAGGGMASGRGAAMKVHTDFRVLEAAPAGAAPRARVEISSRADLQGVLASFASTGGAVLAKQVMQDFAVALTAQLSAEAPAFDSAGAASAEGLMDARRDTAASKPAALTASSSAAPTPTPVRPLSASSLLWRTFVAWLSSLWPPRRRDSA